MTISRDVSAAADATLLVERRSALRALVVEDDEAILMLVRRVLEREGFSVEGTKSSSDAIQLLKTIAYDLLILDLKLRPESGEEVMSFLEDAQPHTLRRVIVMTASPRQLSCEFLERICKILSKPFDIDELVLLARECVEDSSTASCATP
jgi:putative two-component system response regulator/two-component system response regulator RpaA